ncbi:MAG: hypothetical protein H0U60_09645 [Blastocatellia bacterium]|nr:hypothetical protein [Blastocatellia bacterium]
MLLVEELEADWSKIKVESDKLVMWGWNPGDGRKPVDMPHDEFARRFQEWARLGAACPY